MRIKDLATGAAFLARALATTERPLLAHLVVTRRCNLRCAYCTEFDSTSDPLPHQELQRRIDALARLRTVVVTLTGGEPLLHPNLTEIVRSCRDRGMITTCTTNGYLLTPERIRALNEAGLHEIQISIDNVKPNDVSFKSLSILDRKLRMLRQHAAFSVNINCVLGATDGQGEEAVEVARRAKSYGFSRSVGIVHDENGRALPLTEAHREAYRQIGKLSRTVVHTFNHLLFQRRLVLGQPNQWKCRAGARMLYVCEEGLVHWCSQQRGYPGIPLQEYTREDLRREFRTRKACSPFCSVNCGHQTSLLDRPRSRQTLGDPRGKGGGLEWFGHISQAE